MIHARAKRLGTYGVDAPYLLVVPTLLILWNLADGLTRPRFLPFAVTAILVASVASGLYTSRRGKFVVWAELLDAMPTQKVCPDASISTPQT